MPDKSDELPLLIDSEFLDQLVQHKAETESVDHKRPIAWDSGDTAAGLTKDILAFANSKGGGWIVIGVEEEPKGVFMTVGLSEEQAGTFETTVLAKWINARCDPGVKIRVMRHEFDGKHFVIIRVIEFFDTPSICTRDYVKGDKHVLRQGTLYTRNQNAECVPVLSAKELEPLLGLVTRKKVDLLGAMMRDVLAGTKAPEPVKPPHAEEMAGIKGFLLQTLGPPETKGVWASELMPLDEVPALFESRAAGQNLVRDHLTTRFWGIFVPQGADDAAAQPWGVSYSSENAGWGLGYHGCWVEQAIRRSELEAQQNQGGERPGRAAGTYLLYVRTIYEATCRFKLLSKLAERLPPTCPVRIGIHAFALRGRLLVAGDPGLLFRSAPCQADRFDWVKDEPSAAEFAAAWQDRAADALFGLMNLMNSDISRPTLKRWVERTAAELSA